MQYCRNGTIAWGFGQRRENGCRTILFNNMPTRLPSVEFAGHDPCHTLPPVQSRAPVGLDYPTSFDTYKNYEAANVSTCEMLSEPESHPVHRCLQRLRRWLRPTQCAHRALCGEIGADDPVIGRAASEEALTSPSISS
jgi:hypothetical protein